MAALIKYVGALSSGTTNEHEFLVEEGALRASLLQLLKRMALSVTLIIVTAQSMSARRLTRGSLDGGERAFEVPCRSARLDSNRDHEQTSVNKSLIGLGNRLRPVFPVPLL